MKAIEPINGLGLNIHKGDTVVYLRMPEPAQAVVESFGWNHGQRILNLSDGAWCYRKQVAEIIPKGKR